jgi:peptide/nickel transport system permease protein
MKRLAGAALRLLRVASLVLLAVLGTMALLRFAPGYFSDSRELDAEHSSIVRQQLQSQQQREGSFAAMATSQLRSWMHGDLGRSRQFDAPVSSLLHDRIRTTARLLAGSILAGWLIALIFALPLSLRRGSSGEIWIALPVALLLAIPAGAMATACLLANTGGPMLVLASVIAVRDFKLVYSLLRQISSAPQLLYARAQGFSTARIIRAHLLPSLPGELLALAMTSFVLALSAIVPIEVIFDVPGLGQLAWNAAMNRDLPVLLAVTLLLAVCIGVAALCSDLANSREGASNTEREPACA